MQLPEIPKPFERATGTVEGRRQCRDCHKLYPVTDQDAGRKCPSCESVNTAPAQTGN